MKEFSFHALGKDTSASGWIKFSLFFQTVKFILIKGKEILMYPIQQFENLSSY